MQTFTHFAEQILTGGSSNKLDAYALESLLKVLRKEGADTIDETLLKLWIATVLFDGMKVSSCKRYLGKIHTLFNQWNAHTEDTMFAQISSLLSDLEQPDIKEIKANLKLLPRLLAKNQQSDDWQLIAIFFYLLYNPQATLADVANLQFTEVNSICPQIDNIVSTFDSSHGRKYVFDLKQGKSRPHEITRKLTRDLHTLLTTVGMHFEKGFSRASISALWIEVALQQDIDIKDIRACVRTIPAECAVLSIVTGSSIDHDVKERIICRVADAVNKVATHWYVMKLRNGATIQDIKEELELCAPELLHSIAFFYPTKTQIRKDGHKRVVEETPYLPNIVFFKTQSTKVRPLFALIGDKAWCFRTSNSFDSEYALISNKQMVNFQQCIGRFTPDIKMELIDDRRLLGKGRKVKIIGGIMAGYEGEILDVTEQPGKRVFFLSITDNHTACWTAYVEDVLIRELA